MECTEAACDVRPKGGHRDPLGNHGRREIHGCLQEVPAGVPQDQRRRSKQVVGWLQRARHRHIRGVEGHRHGCGPLPQVHGWLSHDGRSEGWDCGPHLHEGGNHDKLRPGGLVPGGAGVVPGSSDKDRTGRVHGIHGRLVPTKPGGGGGGGTNRRARNGGGGL